MNTTQAYLAHSCAVTLAYMGLCYAAFALWFWFSNRKR
jgi:hypothetical protein